MSFFDQLYAKLFSKNDQNSRILSHEVIVRNKKYLLDYESWIQSDEFFELKDSIYRAYSLKTKGIEQNPTIHLLKSAYSNGFAISYDDGLTNNRGFQYFFDWLADTIENKLGYRRPNSDIKITNKGPYIETLEKHYLKPSIKQKEIPLNQEYGNIHIEFMSTDDKPGFIKLVANIYNDRSYAKAKNFDVLAEYLFMTNQNNSY